MSEQTDTASQFLVRSKSVCSSPPSPTGTNHSIESSNNDRIEATFSVSAFPLFVPAFSPLIDQPAQRISAVPANETSAGNVSCILSAGYNAPNREKFVRMIITPKWRACTENEAYGLSKRRENKKLPASPALATITTANRQFLLVERSTSYEILKNPVPSLCV